jgi:methionine-rich copper-binding protein CopC
MVRILITLYFLALASSALACGSLKKADPRVGSTVESADHVSLIFTQSVVPSASAIKIMDSSGNQIKSGILESNNSDTILSVGVSDLPAGQYKVNWNVLWSDCNSKTHSSYKFSVK